MGRMGAWPHELYKGPSQGHEKINVLNKSKRIEQNNDYIGSCSGQDSDHVTEFWC